MSSSKPVIYLLPTILADGTQTDVIPQSVSRILQDLDVLFVENVRTARRFISSLKMGKVIDDITFIELTKDTPEEHTRTALKGLTGNAGIISEAGCPGVADPGAVAVRIAHEMGYTVAPQVGPSSILLALMGSGMSGQSFAFHGYLPIDKAARKKSIQTLERESAQRQQTQIFMETPFRNNQLLEAVLEACLPHTRLCIASNLTGSDEFLKTMTIMQWRKNKPDLHKKPTIFLLAQFDH